MTCSVTCIAAADLQNEEPVVVQINALFLEQRGHFFDVHLLFVDVVVTGVVPAADETAAGEMPYEPS